MPKLSPRFRKTTSAAEHSEGTDITDAALTNVPDPFYKSENTWFRKSEIISTWRRYVTGKDPRCLGPQLCVKGQGGGEGAGGARSYVLITCSTAL